MEKDYLIIDRAKWRTGSDSGWITGKGYAGLFNQHGNMCCLGFRCNQMGIPKQKMLTLATPEDLCDDYVIPDLVDDHGFDTAFTQKAILINDNCDLTPSEREKEIKKHFATIGVTVEFVGKYSFKKKNSFID